ncbi:unnamed protein product, partial [Protopolystoma xenopodis]
VRQINSPTIIRSEAATPVLITTALSLEDPSHVEESALEASIVINHEKDNGQIASEQIIEPTAEVAHSNSSQAMKPDQNLASIHQSQRQLELLESLEHPPKDTKHPTQFSTTHSTFSPPPILPLSKPLDSPSPTRLLHVVRLLGIEVIEQRLDKLYTLAERTLF